MMKHGWKTRIEERIYFERKKIEREERAALMELMRMKLNHEMKMALVGTEKEMH